MEADARHDFTATADDELTFRKNDKLRILNMEDDQNWYMAEKGGQVGLVPANYIEVKPNSWYVGKMGRQAVETLLLKRRKGGAYVQPEGAFHVRCSETEPGAFSLSVKSGDKVQHFKILKDNNNQYFLWVVKFPSINRLVEYHRGSSISKTETLYLKDSVKCVEKAHAQYDFTAQDTEEISFRKGDVLEIVNEQAGDGWWLCSLQGRQGMAPANYLKKLSD